MAVNQIKAGVVLNYIVIGLNALVGLVYTPYMLRMMGQSEYGLYSLAASVVAYLTIMDFGFGNAIVRYTAKFRAEGKTEEQYSMFGMFATLYSVIGLLALVGGLILSMNVENLFGATMTPTEVSRAKILLAIMTFNLAISFPMGIYGFIITAYEDFIFQKTLNIVRILLNTAVMVCLLHFGYKAVAMVVVQTVFNLLTFVANYIYCKRRIKVRFIYGRFRWDFFKEIAIYSFWIFLNAIMDHFYWSTGQLILGVVSGTVAVAVLSVAIQLKNMYYTFSLAISNVFLPRVTSMVTTGASNTEMSDLFIRVGRIQYVVIAYVLSVFILFGQQFVNMWAGQEYSNAYIITLLFFVATGIPLIQNLGMTILQARNQMKYRSIMILCVSVIGIAVSIPMTRLYGLQGFGWTIAIAVVLGHGILLNIYYQRSIKLDILRFWKEILKMSVGPIVVVCASLVLLYSGKIDVNSVEQLILWGGLFSVVYMAVFYKFSMNDYERHLVLAPINKLRQKFAHL